MIILTVEEIIEAYSRLILFGKHQIYSAGKGEDERYFMKGH